jgi:hypothetical protein
MDSSFIFQAMFKKEMNTYSFFIETNIQLQTVHCDQISLSQLFLKFRLCYQFLTN